MSCRTTRTSARLAREWALISRRPAMLRRATAWQIAAGPPRSLDDVVTAVGGGGDLSPDADERLRRLVAVARTDDLAARVVVERLRPGLLAIVQRRGQRTSSFEDLLAAAWIAIRTYDPMRRNSSIAASLLADAEWQAFRRQERRKVFEQVGLGPEEPASACEDDPAEELARLIDDAREAGVDRADLELIELLVHTPSTEQVAELLDVTARTVRNRRARITARLREIALVA